MLIKYDVLSVEAMDKIHNCIDLLCDYGYAERKSSLKETYENILNVYSLERDNPEMWKMVWEHKINSLFQMEQQSGIQGIAAIKPKSVDELAVLNSVIRLMAQEKGGEIPLEKWVRYRKNIKEWKYEMRNFGLPEEDIQWLMNHPDITDGIAESQESLMSLVQEERLGGNSLTFADKCRKAIAKKQGKLFEECEKEFFENIKAKNCSMKLADYVWNELLVVQRGYSFNRSHTLAYSIVALQEMNLAFKYPIMFWNCACLITDSGGAETETVEDEEYIEDCDFDNADTFLDEDEEIDEDEDEIEVGKTAIKKKQSKSVNYGKIATAIGKIKMTGVTVSLPNINKSSYTFTPDIENNQIRYGLSGITRISDDYIKTVIANRPYSSLGEFIEKISSTKTQLLNLIKAGCFDEIEDKPRTEIMKEYLDSISEKKYRLTLQNMPMLIEKDVLPKEVEPYKKLFNFNKHIKKNKYEDYYILDDKAMRFYETNFDCDYLENVNGKNALLQKTWDKIYKVNMQDMKNYLTKDNTILNNLNEKIEQEMWEKNASGSVSYWEMESLSFYNSEHELKNVNENYRIANFFTMPEEPKIASTFYKGKTPINIYKIYKIAGTVIDKNKNKSLLTLLTTDGVVEVKMNKNQFVKYDKQISEKGKDGKKHVIEKSWLSKGNKLMILGYRKGAYFIPKCYKNSDYAVPVLKINNISERGILSCSMERIEEE